MNRAASIGLASSPVHMLATKAVAHPRLLEDRLMQDSVGRVQETAIQSHTAAVTTNEMKT